jgi:hypothetical protein
MLRDAALKFAHRRVFEIVQRQSVWFERAVPAQIVHRLVGLGTGLVEGWVCEQVSRPDQAAVLDLEA